MSEQKKGKRYVAIDKRLITEGQHLDFTTYESNHSKTQMSLFLQSDTVVDGDAKVKLREIERLFVIDEEYEKYKMFAQKHLKNIANDHSVPFSEKADIVYEKASEVMDELFKNPDALANMEKSKDVVDGFVNLVLQDEATLASLMKIAAHDYYTHTHSINVSIYSLSLSKYLDLNPEELEAMGMASMLHDLGKSKVGWDIINKNGKLSDQEFENMKRHPAEGHAIAKRMGITDERILAGIRWHHEKLDGGGYPDGLKDADIPLFARIIAVCDIFDALTTKRSYKAAMTSFEAISLMKKQMQGHVDMTLVDALIKMCMVKEV